MYHSDSGLNPKQFSRKPNLADKAKLSASIYFIGLTSLLTDISAEMIASVLPIYLLTVLHVSPMQYGLFDGFFNGSTAIARLLSAYIADRQQKHKTVAFLGYFLSFFSRIGLFFAGFAGLLSVAGIILLDRVGKGIRTAPRDAMIAACAPLEQRGRAFGVHRAMDAVGALLGPVIATVILTMFAQRFDYVFIASVVFAGLGLCSLCLGVKPPSHTRVVSQPATVAQDIAPKLTLAMAITALRQTSFVILCLISFTMACFTISDGMLYLSLQQRYGFSMTHLPLLFSFTALVFMVLAVPMGRLADAWGSSKVFLLGFVCLGLAYCSVVFWPASIVESLALPAPEVMTGHAWSVDGLMAYLARIDFAAGGLQIGVCVCLLGAYYAATDGVLMSYAASLLPSHLHATGMACLATAISLGRVVSSVLFGWLWQSQGQTVAVGWFTLCLLISLLICLIVFYARKRAMTKV